jgi:hypothetical protein
MCLGLGLARARRVRTAADLAVVCGAMALMFALTPHGPAHATGHVHHAAVASRGDAAVLLALLLAGYFAYNAGTWLTRGLVTQPAGPVASARERVLVRGRPAAHIAMSGLMVTMFLASI